MVGDTLFANMAEAYQRLPDSIKTRIAGKIAVHEIARVFAGRLNKTAEQLRETYPVTEHPTVRTHPETGTNIIYVNNAFTSHIKGMDGQESEELLQALYRTAFNPELQCRFRWRAGSLAFWGNRACQHFASSDYFPHVRKI